jgi:hypothetical protein
MNDLALGFLDVLRLRGLLFEKQKTLRQRKTSIDAYGEDDLTRVAAIIGHAWLRCGFPCVHFGHKLAASMLLSDVRNGPDLPMPWPAFGIYVPPGILAGPFAIAVATDDIQPLGTCSGS